MHVVCWASQLHQYIIKDCASGLQFFREGLHLKASLQGFNNEVLCPVYEEFVVVFLPRLLHGRGN